MLILASTFMIILLTGCATTKTVTIPPRPAFESRYGVFEPGDWYLPADSARALGTYIHALENALEDAAGF